MSKNAENESTIAITVEKANRASSADSQQPVKEAESNNDLAAHKVYKQQASKTTQSACIWSTLQYSQV